VDELATEIFNARGVKPVIAQVNAYAASAAYWIASAAEEMVVTPSGEVGSIGVFALHEDVSQLMEREGIKPTLISAGTFKVEGNPYEPLTDDAKAAIQDDVNAYYDMFVRAVARNRGAALKTVREGFGQGRMVRSDQAVSLGMDTLVDLLMDNTIDREGFELKKKRLKARQYEIDLLLKSYDEADDSYNDMLLNLVELSAKSLEYFKGSDLQRQREILNMVFQNLSLNGKKLEYTMRSPFKEFAEVSNIEQWSE